MDSFAIAKWLDEAYPDRSSLFLPDAPVPVDVKSDAYLTALERYQGAPPLPGLPLERPLTHTLSCSVREDVRRRARARL